MQEKSSTWKLDFIAALKLRDIQKSWEIRAMHQPKYFYKYLTFEDKYSHLNLLNGSIFLSNPKEFNDAYDSSFYLDFENIKNNKMSLKKIRAIAEKHAVPKEIWDTIEKMSAKSNERLIKDFNDASKDNFNRVFCMSEINNSNKMWGLYANKHSGFCIEYEVTSELWDGVFNRCLYPVDYRTGLFDLTPFYDSENPILRFIGFILPCIFKNVDWSFEHEWRVVFPAGIANNSQEKIAPIVSKLFLGEKVKEKNKTLLKDIAKYLSVPIFQAYAESTKQNIGFHEITV